MMIVMLGDKIEQVRNAHGLIQARMKRGAPEIFKRLRFEPRDDGRAQATEVAQDFVDRLRVVLRLVGFLIREIGGAELFESAIEIIEAAGKKLVEIGEVPDVFLDRPLVAVLANQSGLRRAFHTLFDPRRRPAQPLDQFGIQFGGKTEIKFSLEPYHPGHARLEALDGEGYGVAAAEAEGGDTALQVAALQFVEQRDEHARTGGADGMAERDCAAVDVYFFRV